MSIITMNYRGFAVKSKVERIKEVHGSGVSPRVLLRVKRDKTGCPYNHFSESWNEDHVKKLDKRRKWAEKETKRIVDGILRQPRSNRDKCWIK